MSFGTTSYNWVGAGRRDWLIQCSTTASIAGGVVENLVNGRVVSNGDYSQNDHGFFCAASESGREFKFVFPWPVLIDEFKWIQDSAGSQGTWKLAGSNDDSSYTDIETGINLGNSGAIDTHAFTNTNGYIYYKLIQTSGSTTTSRWVEEIQFKLAYDSLLGGVAVGATSYGNLDGSGDRHSRMLMLLNVATACGSSGSGYNDGIMNAMLNGVTGAQNCTDATAFHNAETTDEIKIGFRNPTVVDEFTWKQHVVAAHGTWKIAGSNDDITYTDIATGFAIGAGSTSEAFAFTNTDGYFFYKLIQTAGSTSSASWLYEIEFKTAAAAPVFHYSSAAAYVEVVNDGAGSNAIVPAAYVEIVNTSDGSAAYAAAAYVEIISSIALAPTRAFDGGKIYEFQYAIQPETLYSESDWDSIYSIGDRLGNGTMTMTTGFTQFGTNDVSTLIDGWSSGFFANGGAWPNNGYIGWETADGSFQYVSGLRLLSDSSRSFPGWWAHLGGYDGEVWAGNIVEFSQFHVDFTQLDGQWENYKFQIDFTPTFFPWNYWELRLVPLADGETDPGLPLLSFGPEMHFKVYHSVCDGGDRRSTNGRSVKRVTITTSANITPSISIGSANTPLDNLIDGVYASPAKESSTQLRRTGGSPGDYQLTEPGSYIQFAFPRKVIMRETVWNVGISHGDGGEALDSGGNPLFFGRWQWQGSNAANSGYVNVGDPWHFTPQTLWMKSPKVLVERIGDVAQDLTPYLYPYWRMVLVEGPAFGSDANCNIYQVQFNLIDPDNQFPLLEVAFTDDGGMSNPVLAPIVPGNPYVIAFTDNTDDKMTATPTIIPNLSLAVAFTDAAGDGFTTYGSMYPTVYSQTIVIVKGR